MSLWYYSHQFAYSPLDEETRFCAGINGAIRMGASESLWAITGQKPVPNYCAPPMSSTASSSAAAADDHGDLLPGFEDLVDLDIYKIDLKSPFGTSYKILNSAYETIYRARHIRRSGFSSGAYKHIFTISDSEKRDVFWVFNCCQGEISNSRRPPGILVGYVKVMKEFVARPNFQILDEAGNAILDVLPADNDSYKVSSHRGSATVGEFRPRMSSGIKGSVSRDLDVRMKAAVILVSTVVCRRMAKTKQRVDSFNVTIDDISEA